MTHLFWFVNIIFNCWILFSLQWNDVIIIMLCNHPPKKRQLRTLTIIENKRIMNKFGGIFSLLEFKFAKKKLKPYSDLTASMIGEIMHCMRWMVLMWAQNSMINVYIKNPVSNQPTWKIHYNFFLFLHLAFKYLLFL